MDPTFLNSEIYTFVVLPLLIFLARVCDVSIGTVRILTLSKGYKLMTFFLGFFELMVWLLAIGQVFQNLNNFVCYFAYAGGFATGNYVGMVIEEKLAFGSVVLRVITKVEADDLVRHLRSERFRFTNLKAQGAEGDVNILFMVVKRREIKKMLDVINRFNPNAFYTIEDVREVREGVASMSAVLPMRQSR